MKRSSEAFDSDSVGSMSSAPWTTSGKYIGHRVEALVDHRLGEIEPW